MGQLLVLSKPNHTTVRLLEGDDLLLEGDVVLEQWCDCCCDDGVDGCLVEGGHDEEEEGSKPESVARSGVAARPDLTRDESVLIANWPLRTEAH